MKTSDLPSLHPARQGYRWRSALGLVVAALFGWELAASFAWGSLFFLVASLGFAAINAFWAGARVELTPKGLTYHRWGLTPVHVDFRQMAAVSEAGRFTPGISLVFYPLDESGLVDVERPRTLFLPGVERQEELLYVLHRQLPG
ncbi:MAG: hypothetical protein D6790_06815 [Caldilineae bacterium]|nr:MAG: hypothetical protein D6790_06815 [Caldilineae bacterium]